MLDLFRDNPVVNWHEHVWFDKDMNLDMKRLEEIIQMAEATYTDTLVVSNPVLAFDCPPELFRKCNDSVYEAMKHYPKLLRGLCFVNPGYIRESLAEIDRCIQEYGFLGVKLYNQYLISDPILEDLLNRCAEMDIPILEHACKLNFYQEYQPFASHGVHFAKVAQRHPEITFIHAHIGGGGDWEWSLKAIAPYKNVFTDMSGSVCDRAIVEESVRFLGAERILFGTDMSYSGCVGKILGADISTADKVEILNNTYFQRYLKQTKKSGDCK